jgi:lysophospholipase L1-like esterase
MPTDLTRRQFTAAAAMSSLTVAADAVAQESTSANKPLIRPGDTILFQGDSITDAGRARGVGDPNNPAALGKGYAWLAAAQLLLDRPDNNFKIYNRGVSGNKVFQLADRWQEDCLDLKPNVLSILIGVNDIWHKLNGQYDGTPEKYKTDYAALLNRTRDALPEVRLIICEPFVLRCGAVTDKWFPEFDAYCAAARAVATEAGAVFVPFHEMFDAASKLAPPERWAKDGVHPMSDGAALMAHAWLKAAGAS